MRVAHAVVLTLTAAAAALALAEALPPPTSWLEREHPVVWNRPGVAVPDAPPPRGDAANSERCRSVTRAATLAGDRSVVAKGWTLFGPGQVFGETEVLLAASGVDGMCRPLGFQGFVWVDGKLAGTISPGLMDSRTDGAAGLVQLRSTDRLEVEFARYTPADPLCCPSRVTSVSYRVQRTPSGPVLLATEARTSPAAPRR